MILSACLYVCISLCLCICVCMWLCVTLCVRVSEWVRALCACTHSLTRTRSNSRSTFYVALFFTIFVLTSHICCFVVRFMIFLIRGIRGLILIYHSIVWVAWNVFKCIHAEIHLYLFALPFFFSVCVYSFASRRPTYVVSLYVAWFFWFVLSASSFWCVIR